MNLFPPASAQEITKPVIQVGDTILSQAGIAAFTLFVALVVAVSALLLLWRAYQKLLSSMESIIKEKAGADVKLAEALTRLSERIGMLISIRS